MKHEEKVQYILKQFQKVGCNTCEHGREHWSSACDECCIPNANIEWEMSKEIATIIVDRIVNVNEENFETYLKTWEKDKQLMQIEIDELKDRLLYEQGKIL